MNKTNVKNGVKKTPISYYGGKQSMLKHILPLIPKHRVYVEPFFGGGATFWAKEQSEIEIINDFNGNVVNFYRQLKTNFEELKTLVDATPYSREVYKNARVIYECPYIFEPVYRAWAFWVGTSQGFSSMIGSWMSSSVTYNPASRIDNKRQVFDLRLTKRLDLTQIEHMDAVDLIKRSDCSDAFFYLDPPYVNSDQGHYGGYTQEHFNNLLEVLTQIKGKFLLSSYPNEELNRYRQRFGWYSSDKEMTKPSSKDNKGKKIEALTANFPI